MFFGVSSAFFKFARNVSRWNPEKQDYNGEISRRDSEFTGCREPEWEIKMISVTRILREGFQGRKRMKIQGSQHI
jgi:hypothetical protein